MGGVDPGGVVPVVSGQEEGPAEESGGGPLQGIPQDGGEGPQPVAAPDPEEG